MRAGLQLSNFGRMPHPPQQPREGATGTAPPRAASAQQSKARQRGRDGLASAPPRRGNYDVLQHKDFKMAYSGILK
jgi:hypothetical protein